MYRVTDGCGYDIKCKTLSNVQGIVLQHGMTVDNVLSLFVYNPTSNNLGYIPYYEIQNIMQIPRFTAKTMFDNFKAQAYASLGKDDFAKFTAAEISAFGFRQENNITEGDVLYSRSGNFCCVVLTISAKPDLSFATLDCVTLNGKHCEVQISTQRTAFEHVENAKLAYIFDKYMLATCSLNYATLVNQGKLIHNQNMYGVARAELINIATSFDKKYEAAIAALKG